MIKKHFCVFYLVVLLVLGNKRSRLRYWGLVPALISTCLFIPSWEDLTLIVFHDAFYLRHCHNLPPIQLCDSIEGICTLAVFYVSLSCMYVSLLPKKELPFHVLVSSHKYEFTYSSLWGTNLALEQESSSSGAHVVCIAKSWQCKICFDFLDARIISSSLRVKLRS